MFFSTLIFCTFYLTSCQNESELDHQAVEDFIYAFETDGELVTDEHFLKAVSTLDMDDTAVKRYCSKEENLSLS